MMTLLLVSLYGSADAGRDLIELTNGVTRDGVRGLELRLDGSEAATLARRDLSLDPASQRVYPVLLDARGDVVYDGRSPLGVGVDPARSTTTPALPADDAQHVFFVPYHRLDVPSGRQSLRATLRLDAGLAEGGLDVVSGPVEVQMPALEWTFVSLEQPPGTSRAIRWRARLGKDVLATRESLPALVVGTEGEEVDVDVLVDGGRWVAATRATIGREAARRGFDQTRTRLLRVRKSPPRIADSRIRVEDVKGDEPALRLTMSWTLDGSSVDALIPFDAQPFVADPDGTRWILPSRTESAHADLAVHVVPEWALPAHLDGAGP